ncbi:putative disease resistance protein At3g14460 [Juglans regia]|uniref:Disease resistance protein At3g14460 n=1 Tax=Juglans regia TaxID=51240 RepID=A0A6P9EFZ1_JUGRE|nr:putative disease resistance protein At3g14460 [Juglans regia]
MTQKDQLNLKENSTPRPSKRREIPPSTSVVTEDHIYGREEVVEAVLQLLISDKHSDALTKVPNVIPIVGMGGIGKTTLAQLVYNDKRVQDCFYQKAWACVSEDFDVAIVTRTILQSVISENCDGKDLNWMQVKLKEKLLGKKFLVILDDVWNEKYEDWIRLRAPFEAGAPGSSIIVTTRNQGVSSLMGTIKVEPFQLELLPTDSCLSIFSQHALDAKDFSAHPDLKDIGEEIVRKCKGLPLAVKTVGGLLRSTQDRNEWDKVLKSKIWDIPEERSGIAPALMLSYHNLPAYLKRCFAYCSILPKDYEFEEKEVVLLWMAEGLIHPRQDEEEMEDLGSEYFRNLLSRSFFQQSRINESQFVMHDLINDLAQSVAGETCFRMEDRIGGNQHENLPIKARHSSYLGSEYDVSKKFEVFSKLISLRTFLPLMLPDPGGCYLARRVPHELVLTLRYLRVLSFNGYSITELSDSISDLKHLRYLNLSRTQISSLPESIATIYNLQTLLLERCHYLKKLPPMLRKLVNLRHLNIEGANCLEGMPVQIGKLTCLQTLSNLVVGKDNCSGVKELGPLKHLKGKLNISRLENVIEPNHANDAELIKKIKISKLSLEWSSDIDESKDRTSELEVLNGLQPHNALTELGIINYGGTKFPNWLTPPSFPHMVSLAISNCRKCTLLPPLGQLPSLETLSISGMDSVKSVGSEFCGNSCAQCFRSLKTLRFENMNEWEKWSPCEEFPNLHKCTLITDIYEGVVCGSKVTLKSINFSRSLSPISDEGVDMEGLAKLEWLNIKHCEELMTLWSDKVGSLPHDLPFLHHLDIYKCPKLVSLVAEEVDQERLQLRITSIGIKDCIALESLPKALLYNNTCLQSIYIYKCDSLTHFARSHLPPTLKNLSISNCKSMRNLVEDDDNDTNNNSTTCSSGITSLLEELSVGNCPSLESLTSSGELPATLQQLTIRHCLKLESVAKSFHHNSFLTNITISFCENLQLLNGGELLLPSSLRQLSIFNCKKMQGLPNDIYNLTSLRDLKIQNCPSILSFPKQGFPTHLTTLEISHLKITEALFDWGLDNLTSLNELRIHGCQHLVSFSKLTSLKTLWISECEKLTCFPEDGLPPSLLELRINYCQKLRSFTKNGLPLSLLMLHISNCKKLRSFPKNGLPPSLQVLVVYECPLLEECCKKGRR